MYDTDEHKYVARVEDARTALRTWGPTESVLKLVLDLLEDLIREMPKHRDHGQD